MAKLWSRPVATIDGDAADQAHDAACTVQFIQYHNDDNATRWIHVYGDVNTNVTPGTAAGDVVFSVPADSSGVVPLQWRTGADGLTVCASTTASAGGSSPTALSLLVAFD